MSHYKKFTDTAKYLLCSLDYQLHKENPEDLFLYGWIDNSLEERMHILRRLAFGEFRFRQPPKFGVRRMSALSEYYPNMICMNRDLVEDGMKDGKFCVYSEIAAYEALLYACVRAKQQEGHWLNIPRSADIDKGGLEYRLQPMESEASTYAKRMTASVIFRIRAKQKTTPMISSYIDDYEKKEREELQWIQKLYPGYTRDALTDEIELYLDTGICDEVVQERLEKLSI